MLRERALNQARRTLILDAARTAFFELGLDGASLRGIAKRAGYTPGAIYSYFANLEEIYGALLGESLQRLNGVVEAAGAQAVAPDALLRAKAGAFYVFYRDNPKELDLGFYLFNGAEPRGLTPGLNQTLNEQLMAALRPVETQLTALGLGTDEAVSETTAVFAHIVGVLVLNNTGRIRLFRQNPDILFERYMDALIERLPAPRS
ncbi:TetR/AcrR family transcriptional regulator [Thauera linaloolentis]|uniref:TetR family transcriptional regulator n=1 Tax=Thauera linaloolentis (strain DSM 12138 / JCM 21573 / CCUG 41526 / CIP 105981 / IAM 15112 / NBRC 102519 / 47Lol) TaxID=1123367 RepID=N6YAG5_THAL4|nr:TetR/AcrR family transcriptional regulator [Thauera linaloolentis]ENO88505.1 TetR family transcriptional regulator [Thauera linaloolentis 47Lol = DSM 12138]MCM8567468.1 TetR/AcrR family transcriptional regulator [Thauera linaloolentis]